MREEFRANTPPAPEVPAAPEIELGDDDLQDLKGIQYLETTGKLHKGAADQYLDFLKLNYGYQDKWLADNPGKEFDWKDEEHSKWYDANVPNWIPERNVVERAARQADIDAEVDRRWQEKMQPKIDEQAAEEAWQKALPTVAQRFDASLVSMVEKIDVNLANLLKKDGKPNLGKEAEAALDAADPIASDEINDIIRKTGLMDVLVELEKLPIEACRKFFNPEKNPIHRRISQTIANAEREMNNAPRDQQIIDGKQFITAAEYDRRLKAAKPSEKEAVQAELDRTTWRITVDDVAELFVEDAARKAKENIESTKKKLQRYGQKGTPAAPQPPSGVNTPPPQPPPTPPVNQPPYRGSPDLSSSADVTSTGSPSAGTEKSLGQRVTDQLFRK